MLTNDLSPSAAALASVNGLMQLSTALPPAISPFLATALFAWSKTGAEEGAGPIRAQVIWIVLEILGEHILYLS